MMIISFEFYRKLILEMQKKESEMELQKEFDPFVFKKKLLSSAVHPRSTEAMSLEKITSK